MGGMSLSSIYSAVQLIENYICSLVCPGYQKNIGMNIRCKQQDTKARTEDTRQEKYTHFANINTVSVKRSDVINNFFKLFTFVVCLSFMLL